MAPATKGAAPTLAPLTSFVLKPSRSEVWFSPCLINTYQVVTPTLPIASYNFVTFYFHVGWNSLVDSRLVDLASFSDSSKFGAITMSGHLDSSATTYSMRVSCTAVNANAIGVTCGLFYSGTTSTTGDGYGLRLIIFS
jgi:hypothetical protein